MKTTFVRTLLVLGAVLTAAWRLRRRMRLNVSTASTAGNWAYTYTGTIFTPAGPLPAASVGRFHQSAGGTFLAVRTAVSLVNPGWRTSRAQYPSTMIAQRPRPLMSG